jgi:hypothetical protein
MLTEQGVAAEASAALEGRQTNGAQPVSDAWVFVGTSQMTLGRTPDKILNVSLAKDLAGRGRIS